MEHLKQLKLWNNYPISIWFKRWKFINIHEHCLPNINFHRNLMRWCDWLKETVILSICYRRGSFRRNCWIPDVLTMSCCHNLRDMHISCFYYVPLIWYGYQNSVPQNTDFSYNGTESFFCCHLCLVWSETTLLMSDTSCFSLVHVYYLNGC